MSLIKWTPLWEPFDEVDRVFDGLPVARQLAGFVPSLDVYEDQDNLVVETPLAGIKPEEVKISIENDILTIEGKSEKKSETEDKNYYRREVRYGSFHRSIALPKAVKNDQAKATFEDGVLRIVVPKEEKAKAKSVQVEIKKK